MRLTSCFEQYRKEGEYVAWAIKCAEWYEKGVMTFEKLAISKASLSMFHSAYVKLVYRNEITSLEQGGSSEDLEPLVEQYASQLEEPYRTYYKEALWLLEIIIESQIL